MSALDKARARLAAAEDKLARWEAEHAAKMAEREDLDARLGDLVLDDPGAAERADADLARLDREIKRAAAAVTAASARVHPLRSALQRAEAAAKREEADRLRAEARKTQRRMTADLGQLRERYGVEFDVKGVLPALGTGLPWFPPTNWQASLARAADLERQADDLECQAEAVEREFAGVR